MIVIDLNPTIVALGPFILTWHGVFSVVGIFVGVWLAARIVRPRALEPAVYDLAPWAVLGGLVGARLLHVVDNWEYYAGRPLAILAITEGGIAVFGAVAGGALVAWLYLRWRGLPGWPVVDAVAPGLLLGQAIGRIGDVINGEHWGTPAPELPWAFAYTNPHTLGQSGVPAHPAVAYEMVWNLAVLALLMRLHSRRLYPGIVFWTYLLLYAIGRLWTGFFRQDRPWLAGLSESQLVALASIALAAPIVVWLARRKPAPAVG